MNHIDTTLQQLRGGPITSLEMIHRFGITRLAACIHALREDGFRIVSTLIKVPTRWGDEVSVAEYKLDRSRRKPSPRIRRLAAAAKASQRVPVRKAPKRKPRPKVSARARAKGRA